MDVNRELRASVAAAKELRDGWCCLTQRCMIQLPELQARLSLIYDCRDALLVVVTVPSVAMLGVDCGTVKGQ